MSDSDSDFDEAPLYDPTDDDIKIKEVIEDLTGENASLSDSVSSLSTLSLGDGLPSVKPRSYQIEMLEESLNGNIIIAADTGSGKTHM